MWYRTYEVADELFAFADELRLCEYLWDPVANEKANKKYWKSEWRKRRRHPDLEFPSPIDVDLEELSSDHESDFSDYWIWRAFGTESEAW